MLQALTAAPPGGPWAQFGKRAVDLGLSAALLVMLAPVLGICALAVRLIDGRPVVFRQERVGRHGVSFTILKFRTMRAAAGDPLTVAGDPRITALGSRLRRAKLDELPQLWNVLRGSMSLVGPRPELPSFVAAARSSFYAIRHLRPGMADWASLIFRDEERILADHANEADFYRTVLLPRKLALARLYARHISAALDLRLFLAAACLGCGLASLSRRLVGSRLYARARELPATSPISQRAPSPGGGVVPSQAPAKAAASPAAPGSAAPGTV